MAGALVVLEGVEGAGKTTQVARLVARLRAGGRTAQSCREPGGTALGDAVRALLLAPDGDVAPEAEALLFFASRAQLVARVIVPALARGEVVVLDRFFLSSYAYQIAGRGLDRDRIRDANRLAVGGVRPDVTCVLDCPVTDGLARAGRRGATDRLEGAGDAFHARVAAAFAAALTPDWQATHPETGPIVRVEATGAPDEVEGRVARAVAAHVPALGAVLGVAEHAE
ncbi:MAG: dTMP kinase [Gemmatimonadota bacterium]